MEKVKEMMEKKIITSGKQLDTIVYPQTNHTIVYLDVFFCGRHLENFFKNWIMEKKIKGKNYKKNQKNKKMLNKKSNVHTIVYPPKKCWTKKILIINNL